MTSSSASDTADDEAAPTKWSRRLRQLVVLSALHGGSVAVEERANLGLAVAAVAAERANRGELAGLGPPRHGLRVDAEQRRDLRRREQGLGLRTMANRRHSGCRPSGETSRGVLFHVNDAKYAEGEVERL